MADYGPNQPPGVGGPLGALGNFLSGPELTPEQKKNRRRKTADRLAAIASDTSPTDLAGGAQRVMAGFAPLIGEKLNPPPAESSANAFMPKKGGFFG